MGRRWWEGRVRRYGQTISRLPKIHVSWVWFPSLRGSFRVPQSCVAYRWPQSRDPTSCPPSNCPSMLKALLNLTNLQVGACSLDIERVEVEEEASVLYLCGVEWKQFGDMLYQDGTVVLTSPGPQQKWKLIERTLRNVMILNPELNYQSWGLQQQKCILTTNI